MILCFILVGILFVIGTFFVVENDNWIGGLAAVVLAMFVMLIGCSISDNKADKKAVEILKDFNIEYLSDEEVYNSSKAELDKMYKISTFSKNYYYNIGADDNE